ncbi:MAG: hypothetical protein AB7O59_15870 [Pirellulales bacterium]
MHDSPTWRSAVVVLMLLVGLAWLDDFTVIPRIQKVSPRDRPLSAVYSPFTFGRPRAGLKTPDLDQVAAKESLEELVSHLADPRAYDPPMSGTMEFDTQIQQVLRSPRTARLVELLSALSADEANRKSQTICAGARTDWASVCEAVLVMYERPGGPKNTQSAVAAKCAYGAAILALASVAEPGDVVAELQRFQTLRDGFAERFDKIAPTLPHIASNPGNKTIWNSMWFLDPNFCINAVAYAIQRTSPNGRSIDPAVAALLDKLPTHRLRRFVGDRVRPPWQECAPIVRQPDSVPPKPPVAPWAGDVNWLALLHGEGLTPAEDTVPRVRRCEELEIYYWQSSPYFEQNDERIARELIALCEKYYRTK